MASPFQQELQSIHDEVTEISTIMTRLQQRLVDVTRRSEEHGGTWKARVTELEIQNKKILNSVKLLRRQNAELEHKVSQWKPDMDKAIDARNSALRKLHNARKVIRDLVEERLQAEESPDISSKSDIDEEEEVITALKEALAIGRDSSDSGSDKTVRLGQQSPVAGPSVPRGTSRIRLRNSPSQASTSSTDIGRGIPLPEPSVQSPDLSIHIQGTQIEPVDQVWKVHYTKPPVSSEISCGPVSYSRMVKHSVIKKETVELLQSLDSSPDFGLRLHIEDGVAFVFDPIFLEGPSQTYIVDWSSETVNKNFEEYIAQNSSGSPVFQTFVFPLKEDKWFYVGAHTWTVTDMSWLVWPTLGGKSKQKLLKKLGERCHKQVEESQISKLLDDGKLCQLCIRISSTSHGEKTRIFARGMGYEAPAA